MIKLKSLLFENKIFISRRSKKDREKNFIVALQRQIQQYIKDGSRGDLSLSDTPIKKLPDNLKRVGGNLDLSWTLITSLPNELIVAGDLDLCYTPIQSLPNGLSVGGFLDLNNTTIDSLPDNLNIGGDLYLRHSVMTSLPNGLSVGGYLNLSNSSIKSLPNDLKVDGDINLTNTLFSRKYSFEEIKKMLPGVKGRISL